MIAPDQKTFDFLEGRLCTKGKNGFTTVRQLENLNRLVPA
jgi:hypothetical protein